MQMGLAHKYYEDERAQYPQFASKGTFCEYVTAIKKLCRHFKVRMPRVKATSGHRHSTGGAHQIKLNMDWCTWRTTIHEFCHTYHSQFRFKFDKPGVKTQWHGRVHRKLMKRACRYAEKKGWHLGSLKAPERPVEVPVVLDKRELLMAELSGRFLERESKITRREAQVVRLERRIKALNTRLSKARRSLQALRRAKEKSLTAKPMVEEKMAAEVSA
jgi:hypothetical protein